MPLTTKQTPPTAAKRPVSAKPAGKPATKPAARPTGGAGLSLPEAPSEPVKSIEELTLLLYGEKKIGKTSFAARFKGALFLMFEPGAKGQRVFKLPRDPKEAFSSWSEFTRYLPLIEEDTRFSTLVIDTVDRCYRLCYNHILAERNWNHPNDPGHGIGWDAIKQEFEEVMGRLLALGKGVIFTSHARPGEFQTPSGVVYNKLVPTMSGQAVGFAAAIAGVIAYYGYYGEKRYLTVEGSDTLEAGVRLEENFRAKNGRKVHSIPMGNSPDEGFANFTKAFANQQETSGKPAGITGMSDQRARRARK